MESAKAIASVLLIQFILLQFTKSQGFEESSAVRTFKQEPSDTHEVHCSRERSRAAQQIIDDYLTPFVEEEGYQISTDCRLHPDNNLFRDQEEHKIHLDVNEWRCGYCKKSFRAERFLDQHFDDRHYNLLNVSQSKCLADLCGALHCDFVLNSKLLTAKCNPAAVARNRHLCESLANSCFPISHGSSAGRLHELFLHQFCDAHSCSGKIKPFPRGGKKQINLLYMATSILIVMLLPLFYLLYYLYQRDMKRETQVLRRVSQVGRKAKPSYKDDDKTMKIASSEIGLDFIIGTSQKLQKIKEISKTCNEERASRRARLSPL